MPEEYSFRSGTSFSDARKRKKAASSTYSPSVKAPAPLSTPDNAPQSSPAAGAASLVGPNAADNAIRERSILNDSSNSSGGDSVKQKRRERGGGLGRSAAMRGEAI